MKTILHDGHPEHSPDSRQPGPHDAAAAAAGAPRRRPRILRLLIEIPESEAPFQQFSLPMMERHEITICTIFKSASYVPPQIRLFEGDYTVRGYLRTLRAALRAGPYDIVHAHAPHVGFLYLLLAIWRPRLLAGTVMTVHNCYANTKFRNKLLLLPSFALFRRIVCCGQASYDSLPWFYRWLGGRRLQVVVNGVDTGRVDRVREESAVAKDTSRFSVASVCRLVPIKNLPTALHAFHRCADARSRLVFMGDGELREPLIAETRSMEIADRVEFTGMLPREDVYRRLMASDVFLSTSRGEGLPIATLEAMACGCPVLLSDIEPHREIARGADFIPLVAPHDAAGFAAELARFRNMPAGRRAEIGEQCRRLVQQRFGLDSMLDGYQQIFDELMKVRNKQASLSRD